MPQPTARAQELLELVNRMRQAPANELSLLLNSGDSEIEQALAFFNVDRTLLAQQWTTLLPSAPLAWSEALATSAAGHNQQMIAANRQAHQLPGEQGIYDRAVTAGYTGTIVGENIYAFSESVLFTHAGFAIDWGDDPSSIGGIQTPAGHRLAITSNRYREIGIAIDDENIASTAVGPLVVTQDFGNRTALNGKGWLLGVAFQDLDQDNFYDAGEGAAGIQVQVTKQDVTQPVITETMAAGGYQTLLDPGQYQLRFLKGDLLLGSRSFAIDAQQPANVKIDLKLDQPTISIADASKIEGQSGSQDLSLTVSLSSPSLETVTVDYGTVGQTALAGEDFASTSGKLTFNPGETSKNILVSITGDTTIENAETLAVQLTGATNAAINKISGIGTILNDDILAVPVIPAVPPVPPVIPALPPIPLPVPTDLLNLLKVTSNLALNFTPGQSAGSSVNEFGVFAVDDALGKIGNLLPGQDGYTLAALGRSQNVLSTLGGNFFDPNYSRQVAVQPGQLLRFVMTKNETLAEAKAALEAGKIPSALILKESSKLTDGVLNLTDSSDNVVLKTTIAPQQQIISNALQNPSEIMDLSGVAGVNAKLTVKSDAYYKNEVGFYTVDDAITGRIGTLNPGDSGYAEEAIRRSVIKVNSTSGSVVEMAKQLTGSVFLAPYLVANGSQTYFAYLGANSDRVDHIRLLGDNTFGFEDLAGGGDRDFNDVVLGVKFS
jgi:uncharacterized protein YkwD